MIFMRNIVSGSNQLAVNAIDPTDPIDLIKIYKLGLLKFEYIKYNDIIYV